MTPEDLARLHPKLYHVTTPGAFAGAIERHGLLSTSALLDLFDISGERRAEIETRRRPREVVLEHPLHGRAVINDNRPLSEEALANCLDDSLAPADWLRMLNARVFFWASKGGLSRLLGARQNRDRSREILIVDTLSLARVHAPRIDLSPINSGATIRRPARRGRVTFTPMLAHSYDAWRRLRGGRDALVEVAVRGGVPDISSHVVHVVTHP